MLTMVENQARSDGVVSIDRCNTSEILEVVLSSSRRVKRDRAVARCPPSDVASWSFEAEAGVSVLPLAKSGVSRSSGNSWARGYIVYRDGHPVKTVPPLDRLAVREISPRCLSEDERILIADLRREGLSIRKSDAQLDRSPSTISRELTRNVTPAGPYRPHEAHRRAVARGARHHGRRIDTHPELFEAVSELLMQRWSP